VTLPGSLTERLQEECTVLNTSSFCHRGLHLFVHRIQDLLIFRTRGVYECDDCDRSFNSQQSLNQHLNSPAHTLVFECDDCGQTFSSQQSLEQHSAAHALLYKCDECGQWLSSVQDLQQHYKYVCNQSIGSQQALNQHLNS
jgi:DNA-directed RNA polymerase subunit RPC12/RpoP